MQKRTRRPHGIKTAKISISVSAEDLKVLQKEAKRSHDGNVSAVIHELLAALRRRAAQERLIAEFPPTTEEAMRAVHEEIQEALDTPAHLQKPRGWKPPRTRRVA